MALTLGQSQLLLLIAAIGVSIITKKQKIKQLLRNYLIILNEKLNKVEL